MSMFLKRGLALGAAAILGGLAGCSFTTPEPPASSPPPSDRGIATPSATPPGSVPPGGTIVRANARWVRAAWSDLPGWDEDRTLELWPALLRGCERPQFEWLRLCTDARRSPPASDGAARDFLQQRLQPYRVETPEGSAEGLVTGYFEPLVESFRLPRPGYRIPLLMPPLDLATRRPYWTRQQLDTLPAAKLSLRAASWRTWPTRSMR
jgi:membrane-bound lytic murein transglycosylase A